MNSKFRCILTFDFEAMTNPWSAPLVFSHQLINIYLDTEAGGRTDTYKRGAGVNYPAPRYGACRKAILITIFDLLQNKTQQSIEDMILQESIQAI